MSENKWELLEGPCEGIPPQLPSDHFHAIVTDPPAAIGHLGSEWDGDRGGRREWVGWVTAAARGRLGAKGVSETL